MSAVAGRVLGLVAALLIVLAGALVPVASAHAAGVVSVDVVGKPGTGAVADPDYLTELTLVGSGFQGIRNGHGGIYVFFGTVSGSWKPSQGGVTGANYRYVYDDESSPVGYQLFTAFEGSPTGYAANGGTISSDSGTWSATIKVPGATFQAYDRDNNVTTVDCREVQCGIITVGAHGVINTNNESFTPVRFESLYSGQAAPAAPAASAPAPSRSGAEATSGSDAAGEAVPAAGAESDEAAVEVEESTGPTATSDPAEEEREPTALAVAAAPDGSSASLVVVSVLGALLLAAIAFAVWAVLRARRRTSAEPAN